MPGDLSHRFQDPRIGDAPGNELLLDHFQPGVIRIDHHRKDSLRGLVGAAGFEPTTTRTPSECATGQRYAPNHSDLSGRDRPTSNRRELSVSRGPRVSRAGPPRPCRAKAAVPACLPVYATDASNPPA